MSALAIAGPTAGAPSSNPLVAGERVRQLQALIAKVEQPTLPASAPDFAATLDAAQTAPMATSNAPAAPQYAPASSGPTADPASLYQASATTIPAAPATGSQSGPYDPLIARAAARNGLDPAILHGLIQQESGFDPAARSSCGALGLTQLMPGTAASLGVTEPLDPAQSIEGGARYLSEQLQRFGGNVADALAAYNAGPGAVQSYGGVPPYPETQDYVDKVLGYAAAYRQSAPATAGAQATVPTVMGTVA
jgi:soluble lytic murein transglycosylase-like protein